MTWVDDSASNTTNRNTSRFVLLSPVRNVSGINFQPAIRSVSAEGRGGSFYITTDDAIRLHSSGDSTV